MLKIISIEELNVQFIISAVITYKFIFESIPFGDYCDWLVFLEHIPYCWLGI